MLKIGIYTSSLCVAWYSCFHNLVVAVIVIIFVVVCAVVFIIVGVAAVVVRLQYLPPWTLYKKDNEKYYANI